MVLPIVAAGARVVAGKAAKGGVQNAVRTTRTKTVSSRFTERQSLGGRALGSRFDKKTVAGEVARFGISALSGGAGRTINKTVQRHANSHLKKGAEVAAQKYLKKHYGGTTMKLSGMGFWVIFGVSLFKEVIDMALTLTVALSLLVTLFSMALTCVIWFYLYTHGVKQTMSKAVTLIISAIIEIIPLLSFFPTFPLSLLILRYTEQKEFDALKKKGGGGAGVTVM